MASQALADFRQSITSWRLWMLLGWLEIRQRYARSRIGPFWLTISMGVVIASIGVVFGTLFGHDLREFLPFLAASLVAWGMFTGTVTEGSHAYIANAAYIRQVATPKFIYVLQVTWRNFIIFCHNFVIVIGLLMIFGVKRWDTLVYFPLGLLLLAVNATWITMLVGLLSARFRDMPQIVASMMQVAFYITPIMYKPEALTKYSFIVDLNPLAYLLDVVRKPLLGEVPEAKAWVIAIALAVVGWSVAMVTSNRYLKRIAYWV